MIPEFSFKVADIEESPDSSLTYKLDINSKRIYSTIEGLESVKQSIYKILSTERFENVIYNADYGIEIKRFIGSGIDFIKSDLQRTITEAITVDNRVNSVDNFKIEENINDNLNITFVVETIYGPIQIESEVKV